MNTLRKPPRQINPDISDFLHGTSIFMSYLTQTVLELESHLLAANFQEKEGKGRSERLQSIDYIRQATEEVALTLARLAGAASNQSLNRDRILGQIKLQALHDCLAQIEGQEPKTDPVFERQAIELF